MNDVRTVLVTTSRMPFALDEIRKLGRSGLRVVAADTFALAPGSHSKHVAEHVVLPSPRYETAAFLDALDRVIEDHAIDLVLPAFEEVFYIARHLDRFRDRTRVFASNLGTLRRLHDKTLFFGLCRELGLPVPRTIVASSPEALARAGEAIGAFIARPAFGRGGLDLYTNTGPLAGELSLDDCTPTHENPWLVQEFLRGTDYCSFSVVHGGRIAAHSAYVHPKTIDNKGGIVFESVDAPATLEATRRIVESLRYHGQISIDFMKTEDGRMIPLECNPRPTAGVVVMSDEMFTHALLHPDEGAPQVAPAGTRRKIGVALIRDMVLHWKEIPSDLYELFSPGRDVYVEKGDLLPGLYQFLSYAHVAQYRRHLDTGPHPRSALMAAYFHDVLWNGEPIA